MAITDKEQGVWDVDQVYNKINQGGIWSYDGGRSLFMVGNNGYGRLGLNEGGSSPSAQKSSPTQVGSANNYSESGSMGGQSFAVKSDGTLWAWGNSGNGVLGQNQGPGNSRSSPTQVGTDTTWSKLSRCSTPGQSVCLATKTDGTLWSWGYQPYGNLGLDLSSPQRRSSPTQIPGTTWSDEFAMCPAHGLGIKTDGTLWAWGARYRGQVGNNESNPGQNAISAPVQIGSDSNWSKVVGGTATSGAIKTDGTLWLWVGAEKGALGQNEPANSHRSSPVQVPGTWSNAQVIGSQTSVHAIKTDGTLWAWGSMDGGVLGINKNATPTDDARSSPAQVGTDTTWETVSSGGEKGMCSKTDGTWWVWGVNENGQLGLNQPNNIKLSSPTQMPGSWGSIKYVDGGMTLLKIS